MIKNHRLEKIFHDHGLRYTRQRQLVFDFFESTSQPITLPRIIMELTGQIDRASVYRIVDSFKRLDVIREVHQAGQHWLELGENFEQHHHHITCANCGISRTIVSPKIEQHLDQIAQRTGFKITDHQLEINGLCRVCSALGGN